MTVNGTPFTIGYLTGSNVVQSVGTSAVGTTWTYNTSGASDGDLQSVSTSSQIDNSSLYTGQYNYNANDQLATATVAQDVAASPRPGGWEDPE